MARRPGAAARRELRQLSPARPDYEVAPDNGELVHHAILYTLDSEAAEQQPLALDAADEPPGYGTAVHLPLGVYLQGVSLHMHKRGRTLSVQAWRPDDTLRLRCTFDTTDDTDAVRWGEGTDDEMCLIGLVATLG